MVNNCKHCGLPNKNQSDEFCCRGCSLAYQIINNLGFSNYYQTRHLDPKIKPLKPEENNSASQIDIGAFVAQVEENHFSINLMVEGMHCAACVWLIENVLKKQPAVIKARINMTSKKLYLEWSGDVAVGNDLVQLIF